MKKIFVTVAEFLENGGELKVGRLIFGEDLSSRKLVPFGELLDVTNDDFVIYKNNAGHNDEDGDEYLYVQIDCTPHYK